MENTVTTNNDSNSKAYQWFLIFLCFFIYFTAQLGRYSYTSNINLFEKTAGVTYTEAGLVSTLYFLTYGAGQIVNGLLCKRYNKRVMCLIAVLLSSAINFLVFLGVPFNSLYALWALNAAAQSILYPSVMLTISENVEKKYLAAASIVMSCATTA
ncbi:MAG: MFS transporter, partial [Candidatus Borkfalkiaceae bacterium]|nr:MFS transporter [Christensenellaceae bacterium]